MSPLSRRSAGVATTWVARALWVVTGVIGSGAIHDALAGRSGAVRVTATVAAWLAWGGTLAVLAVASTATLTAARVLVPLGVVAAFVALLGGAGGARAWLFLAIALVTTLTVFTAELGAHFVQSSAYGAEARFLLRPPLGYAVAAITSWLVVATAVVVAVLAWPARAWLLAAVATLVAGAGLVVLPRRWHQLARRWFVFVPAGVVVHDPVVMADTLMIRSPIVADARLVGASDGAADLTGPTPGPLVRFDLHHTATAVFAPTRAEPRGRAIHLAAFVVAPSRPGAVLSRWAMPPPSTHRSSRS